MAGKYRAAVIGRTGAGDYGHGLDIVFNGLSNVEVVAVADPDPAGRAACAARINAREQYADYREMLAKAKPQLVSIGPRWVDCHHDMVIACAEAGVRGIYCEKPFARTLAEADAMLDACARTHTYVAVAHQNRAIPYLPQAKQLVEEGAIGRLTRIRARGKDDARGGGQDLIVLGTHVLDMMRYFGGNPTWAWGYLSAEGHSVTGADVRDGAEQVGPIAGDTITIQYGLPHGVIGSFESVQNPEGRSPMFGIVLEGTRGTITLHGGFDKQAWLRRGYGWLPEQGMEGWERLRIPGWDNDPAGKPYSGNELLHRANQRMVQGLIDCIEQKRDTHFSSGDDARWALEMIFAAAESHRLGGQRVTLPLANRQNPYAMLGK